MNTSRDIESTPCIKFHDHLHFGRPSIRTSIATSMCLVWYTHTNLTTFHIILSINYRNKKNTRIISTGIGMWMSYNQSYEFLCFCVLLWIKVIFRGKEWTYSQGLSLSLNTPSFMNSHNDRYFHFILLNAPPLKKAHPIFNPSMIIFHDKYV